MKLEDYCDNARKELSSWKFRIDNIVKHFDGLKCDDREKITSEINELNILSTELDDRIEELKKSCSIAWEPVGKDGYAPHVDMRGDVEKRISEIDKGSGYSIPG